MEPIHKQWADEAARTLGGEAYPHGTDWRCLRCDFTCDDDGPDSCPRDGTVLVRTLVSFKQS